jgi:hypothetical protein
MVFAHANRIFSLRDSGGISRSKQQFYLEKSKVFITDLEYEILDELYFVISFEDLKQRLPVKDEELKYVLSSLLQRNYIKCFSSISDEIPPEHLDFENNYRIYHYLASKEGLFAHNTK